MSAFHKDSFVYSKDEANICLTCTSLACRGSCDKLKAETKKLRQPSNPTKKERRDVQHK